MNDNTMRYKGYVAAIEYSADDDCFVGTVMGVRHAIVFDGTSVEEIREHFKEMIDDYPAMCLDMGQEPNLPTAEVMVGVDPALYAKVAEKAEYDGISVHHAMETALRSFVSAHQVH
jgi:predicted HicB family RNase H-like nuclease